MVALAVLQPRDALPVSLPLISAIVTCYNREHYLGEAIDSILAQDLADIEIVLVDDGSTDGSAAIARAYGSRLRYLYQDNRGASAAKNAGVAAARGSYLAFLDSDDRWTADKLRTQVAYLREASDTDLLYAHGRQFLSPELSERDRERLHCPPEPMPAPISGTLMLTPQTFRRVGPFRTDLVVGIDVEWHLRGRALGLSIHTLPEVLLHRRIHAGNSALTERSRRAQHIGILKDHLDRVRRSAPTEAAR